LALCSPIATVTFPGDSACRGPAERAAQTLQPALRPPPRSPGRSLSANIRRAPSAPRGHLQRRSRPALRVRDSALSAWRSRQTACWERLGQAPLTRPIRLSTRSTTATRPHSRLHEPCLHGCSINLSQPSPNGCPALLARTNWPDDPRYRPSPTGSPPPTPASPPAVACCASSHAERNVVPP